MFNFFSKYFFIVPVRKKKSFIYPFVAFKRGSQRQFSMTWSHYNLGRGVHTRLKSRAKPQHVPAELTGCWRHSQLGGNSETTKVKRKTTLIHKYTTGHFKYHCASDRVQTKELLGYLIISARQSECQSDAGILTKQQMYYLVVLSLNHKKEVLERSCIT